MTLAWHDDGVRRRSAIAPRETAVAYWLFKEEPEHYSYADLEREGRTLWTGVTNNLARKNLRAVRPGDRIWFYHTGSEKQIVGEMVADSGPLADPEASDAKGVAVEVRPVRRLLAPVSLQTIKDDPGLAGWELLRLSRLSVVPVTTGQWQRVEALNNGSTPKKKRQGAGR